MITPSATSPQGHSHVFLGAAHNRNESKTWAVIWLCGAMMVIEIVGGAFLGSLALVADGLHMSTHAGALLLAALAYTYARKHADDPAFAFGTGKIGDLAGFTSAVILAMIALLIGYEGVARLLAPVAINFAEAIPIAVVGLLVNIGSAWLLSGGHDHGHGHGHSHGHVHGPSHDHDNAHQDDETRVIAARAGALSLSIFENGVPPCFRITCEAALGDIRVEIRRPEGDRQTFTFADHGAFLQSNETIPEPHAFEATLMIGTTERHAVHFAEHAHHDHAADQAHDKQARDNNMRAAFVHVLADAAVSILVIVGLLLARAFGWLWMDPLAGMIGAIVIASWAFTLIKDTGGILLDRMPDPALAAKVRAAIEAEGGILTDLHLWRLGPGHIGAIVSLVTERSRGAAYYRAKLARFTSLSHVTVEVIESGA